VALEFKPDISRPVANARGFGAEFGNIQHFLHVAQAVRPFGVLNAGNRPAPTPASIGAAKLIEEIPQVILCAAPASLLAIVTPLTTLSRLTRSFVFILRVRATAASLIG
jgi:hypothetical protein